MPIVCAINTRRQAMPSIILSGRGRPDPFHRISLKSPACTPARSPRLHPRPSPPNPGVHYLASLARHRPELRSNLKPRPAPRKTSQSRAPLDPWPMDPDRPNRLPPVLSPNPSSPYLLPSLGRALPSWSPTPPMPILRLPLRPSPINPSSVLPANERVLRTSSRRSNPEGQERANAPHLAATGSFARHLVPGLAGEESSIPAVLGIAAPHHSSLRPWRSRPHPFRLLRHVHWPGAGFTVPPAHRHVRNRKDAGRLFCSLGQYAIRCRKPDRHFHPLFLFLFLPPVFLLGAGAGSVGPPSPVQCPRDFAFRPAQRGRLPAFVPYFG